MQSIITMKEGNVLSLSPTIEDKAIATMEIKMEAILSKDHNYNPLLLIFILPTKISYIFN